MNKRKVGAYYETLAAAYLCRQGYKILERNFQCRTGEIDIIAGDGEYLCFIEVKFRSSGGCGLALEAVTPGKQKKITGVAQYYMKRHGYPADTLCRFDVVAVSNDEIMLVKNAFM